ncbi:PQQ-binding-like beta-propeller repeat protein [Actinoplanes sp. NPDC049802]|uniref:outer membrane protein assembly factor BamB family protein n=1 Tax=Actinoplanes sp. NPDC049802 TaxID=3154742 RepID=UPI0033F6F89E
MRDRVIDLGEVPAGEPGEAVLPGAPPPYRWILGSLALVLLIALGGAAPAAAPPPPPRIIPLTLRDAIRVSDDRLYLIGPGEPVGGPVRTHTVRGYLLPGVTELGVWTAALTGDVFAIADGGDGTLLISHSDPESGRDTVTAVRPGSTEPVWRRAGLMFGLSGDRGTALIHDDDEGRHRQAWHGLDSRTGKVRWTVGSPPDPGGSALRTGYFYTGFPELIYTLHGDGRLEARETGTGRVTVTTRILQPVDDITTLWVAGGVLGISHGDETVAYDDTSLAERWRSGPLVGPDGYLLDCKPLICAFTRQDGLAGIDPATGRQVWRQDGWDSREPLGDHVMLSSAARGDPELAVLDTRTGRIIARAGRWSNGGPGPRPGTAYVHRVDATDNTMRYGVLELATGKVRLLGSADRIAGDCQFRAGVLICRRLDASAGIWRL